MHSLNVDLQSILFCESLAALITEMVLFQVLNFLMHCLNVDLQSMLFCESLAALITEMVLFLLMH